MARHWDSLVLPAQDHVLLERTLRQDRITAPSAQLGNILQQTELMLASNVCLDAILSPAPPTALTAPQDVSVLAQVQLCIAQAPARQEGSAPRARATVANMVRSNL